MRARDKDDQKLENIFIFIADCLRFDHVPKSIAKNGTLIPTLAPALFTAPSIASIVTARNRLHHNVRTFFDILDPSIPTIFDFFKNATYYDHPDSAMVKIVFKHVLKGRPVELMEIKEPFVWIERALETHHPYGRITHGNKIEHLMGRIPLGSEYLRALKRENAYSKEYSKGVDRVEEHFWCHIVELDQRGLLEKTLVVFTSDHGELLGEKVLFRRRYTHGFPPCLELVKVPTVFLGTDVKAEWMRSIDIVPTALALMGKRMPRSDGVDVNTIKPKVALNVLTTGIKYIDKSVNHLITVWEFVDGDFQLSFSRTPKSVFLNILIKDFYEFIVGRAQKERAYVWLPISKHS